MTNHESPRPVSPAMVEAAARVIAHSEEFRAANWPKYAEVAESAIRAALAVEAGAPVQADPHAHLVAAPVAEVEAAPEVEAPEFAITVQAVGTRTGSKVHTVTVVDGRGTSRTTCGARAVGMFPVTLAAVEAAAARGTLCRNCAGNGERLIANLRREAEAATAAEAAPALAPEVAEAATALYGDHAAAEVAALADRSRVEAEAVAARYPAVPYGVQVGTADGEAPGRYRRFSTIIGWHDKPGVEVGNFIRLGVDADGRASVLDPRDGELLTLGTLRRHEDGRRWYAARMDAYGAHHPATLHATRREAVLTLLAGTAYAPPAEVSA